MSGAVKNNDLAKVLEAWQQHQTKFTTGFIKFSQVRREKKGDETDNFEGVINFIANAQPPSFTLLLVKDGGKRAVARTGSVLNEDYMKNFTEQSLLPPGKGLQKSEEGRVALLEIAKLVMMGAIPSRDIDVSDAMLNLGLLADSNKLATTSFDAFAEKMDDARTVARLPKAKFIAAEAARFAREGLDHFKNSLNKEALMVLYSCGQFKWRDYIYYSAESDLGVVRRQAATEYPLLASKMIEFPSIKNIIDERKPLGTALQNIMGQDSSGKPVLSKAVIDRLQRLDWPTGGIPIDKLLASISAFNKVTDPKRDVPTDWFPKTREEWDAFCDISETFGTLLKENSYQGLGTLYTGCGGKWVELRDRLAKAYTDDRPPEGVIDEDKDYFKAAIDWKELGKLPKDKVEAAAQKIAEELQNLPERINRKDIELWITRCFAPVATRSAMAAACVQVADMTNGFANKVLLPLAANGTSLEKVFLSYTHFNAACETAARMLLDGKAATNAVDLGKKYHNNIVAIMTAGADDENDEEKKKKAEATRMITWANALGVDPSIQGDEDWPYMTPIIKAPNDVWIIPLTSSKLLEMEGYRGVNADGTEGLHHCVGTNGYDAVCRRGGHIISMREMNENETSFRRLSTAEITPLVQGELEIKVRQHQGRGNGAVPQKAAWAFDWYREQILNRNIALNYEGVTKYLGMIGGKIDEVQAVCDYDWRDRSRIERAFKAWCDDKPGFLPKKYRKMNVDELQQESEVQALIDMINPRYRPLSGP